MVITVAGSSIKIQTLYKIEAERVAAIYHEMKKAVKLTASTQNVSEVTTKVEESPIEKLKKLSELKDAGIITEEEFNSKKAELMAQI